MKVKEGMAGLGAACAGLGAVGEPLKTKGMGPCGPFASCCCCVLVPGAPVALLVAAAAFPAPKTNGIEGCALPVAAGPELTPCAGCPAEGAALVVAGVAAACPTGAGAATPCSDPGLGIAAASAAAAAAMAASMLGCRSEGADAPPRFSPCSCCSRALACSSGSEAAAAASPASLPACSASLRLAPLASATAHAFAAAAFRTCCAICSRTAATLSSWKLSLSATGAAAAAAGAGGWAEGPAGAAAALDAMRADLGALSLAGWQSLAGELLPVPVPGWSPAPVFLAAAAGTGAATAGPEDAEEKRSRTSCAPGIWTENWLLDPWPAKAGMGICTENFGKEAAVGAAVPGALSAWAVAWAGAADPNAAWPEGGGPGAKAAAAGGAAAAVGAALNMGAGEGICTVHTMQQRFSVAGQELAELSQVYAARTRQGNGEECWRNEMPRTSIVAAEKPWKGAGLGAMAGLPLPPPAALPAGPPACCPCMGVCMAFKVAATLWATTIQHSALACNCGAAPALGGLTWWPNPKLPTIGERMNTFDAADMLLAQEPCTQGRPTTTSITVQQTCRHTVVPRACHTNQLHAGRHKSKCVMYDSNDIATP